MVRWHVTLPRYSASVTSYVASVDLPTPTSGFVLSCCTRQLVASHCTARRSTGRYCDGLPQKARRSDVNWVLPVTPRLRQRTRERFWRSHTPTASVRRVAASWTGASCCETGAVQHSRTRRDCRQ